MQMQVDDIKAQVQHANERAATDKRHPHQSVGASQA